MESALSKRPPGDPKLVEAIVQQLKSGGKFDQFRKECLADVDTKPAYQNLQLRVESLVKTYLSQTEWKADINKNQLRDGVRKHVQESGMLDTGIDTIINQVVNPKIQSVILPCVQESVYAFLDIDPTKLEEDVPFETRIDDSGKEALSSDAGGNIGHGPLPPPPGPSQPMPYAYAFPPQHPPPHHYPPQHFAPPAPHYPNHPQHPPVMMPPGPMDVPPIVPPVPMEGPPLRLPPPIAPPLPIEAPPMMPPVPPMEAPPMPLTMPMDGALMGQPLPDPHFGHHPLPPTMDHLPPPITTHPPYPEPVMAINSPTEDSTSSDYTRERRDYRSDLQDSRQRPQTPVEADSLSGDRLEYRSKHDDKRSLVDEKEERREHRRRLINRDSPDPLDRHDSRSGMRLHESRRARDVHDSDDGYRVAKYGDARKGSPERDEHRSRREGEKHEHHRRKYEDYRRVPEEDSRRKGDKHSHRSSKYDQRKHAQKHYEERRYDSPDTSMEYDTDSPHVSGKHRRRVPYDAYGEPLSSQDRGPHRSLPVHGETSRAPHSPLIPMETDVISSEEDDILGARSCSVSPDLPKEHPMVEEEDARDGFSRPGSAASDTVESKVQQLSLQDMPAPLFDVQSLDSISSNSSGLSFSASKPCKDESSLNASQSSLPGVDSSLGVSQPLAEIAADESIRQSSPGDNLLLGASPISAEDSSGSHCASPPPLGVNESKSKPLFSTSKRSSSPFSSPRDQSPVNLSNPRSPSPPPLSDPRPPSPPPLSDPRPPSPPPLSDPRPPSPLPMSSPRPLSPMSSIRPPSPMSNIRPPSPVMPSFRPSSPSMSSPRPPSPLSSHKPPSPLVSRPSSFPTEEKKPVQHSSTLAPRSPVHPVSLSSNTAPVCNLERLNPVVTSDSEPSDTISLKVVPPDSTDRKPNTTTSGDDTVPADKTTKDKSTDPPDDHSVHRQSFGWRKDEPDDESGNDGGNFSGGLPFNVPSTSVTGSSDLRAKEPSQPPQGQTSGSAKEHTMFLHTGKLSSNNCKSANFSYSVPDSVNQTLTKTRELMEVEITVDASQKLLPVGNSTISSSVTNFSSSTVKSVSTCVAGTLTSVSDKRTSLLTAGCPGASVQKPHINVVARPHHIPILKGLKTPLSTKKDKIGNCSVSKKHSSTKKEMKAGHVPTAFENALLGLHTKKTSHIESQRRKSELDLKLSCSNIITSTDTKQSEIDKATQKTKEEKSKEENKESRSSSMNREKESTSSDRKSPKHNEKESTSLDGKHRKHDGSDLDRRNRDKRREKYSNHHRRSSSDRASSEKRHEKRTSSNGKSKRPDKEKSRHKTDNTDMNKSDRNNSPDNSKHFNRTSESSEKTFSKHQKSHLRQENDEQKVSSDAIATKLELRSNKSPVTKAESQLSTSICVENISPTSSGKRKEASGEATMSNDHSKKIKLDNHSQDVGIRNTVSSECSKSKHSSYRDGKTTSTVSRKTPLSSDSSSEDELPLLTKKRSSKSLTISTDDEVVVRSKRKIVKKVIVSSPSCASETFEQTDEELKHIRDSYDDRKIAEAAKETPINIFLGQKVSMADSCSEDSLPVKKRRIRRASKILSESDDEIRVQKRSLEAHDNLIVIEDNQSQPKKNSVICRNSQISSSSDDDDVPLTKFIGKKSYVSIERIETIPNQLIPDHDLNEENFKAEIHSMSNRKDNSDSSDSFYDELMKQTCKAKNLKSTAKPNKRHSSRSLETRISDKVFKNAQKKSLRKSRKSTARNISVTEEGVVITADHGKRILLCYDENSLSNDANTCGLFSSEDSDQEEFHGFTNVHLDCERSSPVVVLEEMYDFVGFHSSVSSKAEKLRQYLERRSCHKIYSADDLSMTVTGDMFGPELPMKVFLDAMVHLGAKVSGFHAFLANSPKKKSLHQKKKTAFSCFDSFDGEISGPDRFLSLDSDECEGVLSSESESSDESKNAPQVRIMVDTTTSLPSEVEINSGTEINTTKIIGDADVMSRSEAVTTKPTTPQSDSVLLTPPDDEYSGELAVLRIL
ncbi:hypothetical protein FHG87_009719 [Trinorchestia longiramus]|nr:hypothetical protein FHG87_009719 [Trinorchestia longiramus]